MMKSDNSLNYYLRLWQEQADFIESEFGKTHDNDELISKNDANCLKKINHYELNELSITQM